MFGRYGGSRRFNTRRHRMQVLQVVAAMGEHVHLPLPLQDHSKMSTDLTELTRHQVHSKSDQ